MKLINNLVFWLEMVLILVPITAILFLLGFPIAAEQVFDQPSTDNIVVATITLLAVTATISVWVVLIRSSRDVAVLDKNNVVWWALILIGLVVSVAAVIVPRVISVEPYSEEWWFYDQVSYFAMGLPLLIPAIHALVMGLARHGANKAS